MQPIVVYAGRELSGSSEWTVSFDLVKNPSERKRYWIRFRVHDGEPDVDQPNFWGYVAYLGGKFIENRQIFSEDTGQLYSPIEEAVARARTSIVGMGEPRVGQVCWRFGSPPYEEDTSDDAFQVGRSRVEPGPPTLTTKRDRTFVGVDGYEYQTRARQGSAEEVRLQAIQYALAGKDLVGSHEPIAHLFLADQVDGPPVIGLWVPSPQERQAEDQLSAAGFRLS